MKNMQIISHIRKEDLAIQTNEAHSFGVAERAELFTQALGMPGWGTFLGLLHDKGKEKNDFQTYIRLMNELPTDSRTYQDKTHAYVGALLAKRLFPVGYLFVAYALAGHHAGMPDFNSLEELLKKDLPEEVSWDGLPDVPSPPSYLEQMQPSDLNHLFRLLYSCLVDADYLDTENFMMPGQARLRNNQTSLADLLPKLEVYYQNLAERSADTPVNRIRKQVQDVCRQAAERPSGVYSLTVPTGGGKTLSSILWAMLHAIRQGKQRIILSIPYTSIITQTAAVLKKIFGDDQVLEHHSNLAVDETDVSDETALRKKLATENWDFPIIVTTNVQLLESMYASHPSACRKLHNIANSVLLFDEVQTLPGERLQPIIDALRTYQRFFGVSLLFTTASQPTLEGVRPGHQADLLGFEKIEEIVPATWHLHEKLRRVHLHFCTSPLTYQEISEQLLQHPRVLCIVNTRKDAGEIFSHLGEPEPGALHFHLSRMMCAEHLDHTLHEIKEALQRDASTPIRVVSTQLVEAGVDIDFPVVYRQEAGLDSILQAAGRCNREGKLPELGRTEVFQIEGRRVPLGTLNYANQARLNMPAPKDWFSPEAMKDYFTHFYHQIPTFDKKEEGKDGLKWTMQELLYSVKKLMFDTANHVFRLIDSKGYSVVVHYGESDTLMNHLKNGVFDPLLFRRLNRYAVQLNEHDFKAFVEAGMIESVQGLYYLSDSAQYHSSVGLKLDNHWIDEILIQ